MSATKWFDTDAEMQKLGSTPAKPAKPAKVADEPASNFSNFSNFSRGVGVDTQFSPPPATLPAPFQADARKLDSEAATWLRHKLATGPQRLGELMGEWCEPVRGQSGQDISTRIDLLTAARWELDVFPYIDDGDGRFWWRLPDKKTVQ